MSTMRLLTSIAAGFLSLLITAAPSLGNELRLTTRANGSAKVVHGNGYPLVIQVTIADPLSANQLLDSIAGGGARPTARTTFGSPTSPFFQQLKFYANGQPLPVHVLKQSKENTSAVTVVDANHSAHVSFGVDNYSATGNVEITAQYSGAPSGVTLRSVPARVNAVDPSVLTETQKIAADYNAANCFIMDGKYDAAKPYIKALETLLPLTATTLNAEGAYEAADYTSARAYCLKALQIYQKNAGQPNAGEPPTYLLALLAKIDEKLFPAP